MAREDFIKQLKDIGYDVQQFPDGRVAFPYEIPCGRRAGEKITLGFIVPEDFHLTPPSGPHMSPCLLPLKSGGEHPSGGIHESPQFGASWQYWSRPLNHWNKTKREPSPKEWTVS
jgi:hypothetical protein